MTDAFMAKSSRRSDASSQPGQHQKELNPHWSSGSEGLPSKEVPSTSVSINSWTKMKVQSAIGTIERGEGTLEQIAAERFGTLEEFTALCKLCGLRVPNYTGVSTQKPIPLPVSKDSIFEDERRAAANDKMEKYISKRRQREESVTSSCSLCDYDTKGIISEADYTFLAIPTKPINPFHLLIIPRQHEECSLDCGAAVLNEIRNYKKCLIHFYATRDCDPVFVELRRRVNDRRQHTVIECFGVPNNAQSLDTNIYLRKQLTDSESYWSTHKPIIECPDGLARALPRRPFPFLHIDLWTDSFVHIIEDDRLFPSTWPRDVVGKLCQVGFDADFGPFDWTSAINL